MLHLGIHGCPSSPRPPRWCRIQHLVQQGDVSGRTTVCRSLGLVRHMARRGRQGFNRVGARRSWTMWEATAGVTHATDTHVPADVPHYTCAQPIRRNATQRKREEGFRDNGVDGWALRPN